MCHLDKDFLELYLCFDSYGICIGSFPSAQLNHDLVTWLMVYAININHDFLATWKKGARVFSYFLNALDSSP